MWFLHDGAGLTLCCLSNGELGWLFHELDTGLNHCLRILLSCFRVRIPGSGAKEEVGESPSLSLSLSPPLPLSLSPWLVFCRSSAQCVERTWRWMDVGWAAFTLTTRALPFAHFLQLMVGGVYNFISATWHCIH